MTCTLLMALMVAPVPQSHSAVVSAQSALQHLSAARPEVRWDAKSGVRADFDCDERPDRAFLGRNAGRVYVGLIRAAGQRQEILDFAVSAAV
jgi:hypothetical protein